MAPMAAGTHTEAVSVGETAQFSRFLKAEVKPSYEALVKLLM